MLWQFILINFMLYSIYGVALCESLAIENRKQQQKEPKKLKLG